MGYTNETTHYGIPLPLGTDKTTPMDYNESMQDVDTVLFGAKSDSDSALRKAEQVEEGLSQTNENVTNIAGRVSTLEGTSVTHGNAIQQNAQDIADVRADALDMIEAKDEGTAQVATIAVNAGEYFRYNNVLYIATQNIDVNDTIVPNTNCKATNVGTELANINGDLGSKSYASMVAGADAFQKIANLNSIIAGVDSHNYHAVKDLSLAGASYITFYVSNDIPMGYKVKPNGHLVASLNTNLGLTSIAYASVNTIANQITIGFTQNITGDFRVSLDFEIVPT